MKSDFILHSKGSTCYCMPTSPHFWGMSIGRIEIIWNRQSRGALGFAVRSTIGHHICWSLNFLIVKMNTGQAGFKRPLKLWNPRAFLLHSSIVHIYFPEQEKSTFELALQKYVRGISIHTRPGKAPFSGMEIKIERKPFWKLWMSGYSLRVRIKKYNHILKTRNPNKSHAWKLLTKCSRWLCMVCGLFQTHVKSLTVMFHSGFFLQAAYISRIYLIRIVSWMLWFLTK